MHSNRFDDVRVTSFNGVAMFIYLSHGNPCAYTVLLLLFVLLKAKEYFEFDI